MGVGILNIAKELNPFANLKNGTLSLSGGGWRLAGFFVGLPQKKMPASHPPLIVFKDS